MTHNFLLSCLLLLIATHVSHHNYQFSLQQEFSFYVFTVALYTFQQELVLRNPNQIFTQLKFYYFYSIHKINRTLVWFKKASASPLCGFSMKMLFQFILKAAFLTLEAQSEEKNASAYFAIKLFFFPSRINEIKS